MIKWRKIKKNLIQEIQPNEKASTRSLKMKSLSPKDKGNDYATETKYMIPQEKRQKGLNINHVQIKSLNQKPAPQEEVKAQHNRQKSKRDI